MVFHTIRQTEASTDQDMVSIPTFMSGLWLNFLMSSKNWAGFPDL